MRRIAVYLDQFKYNGKVISVVTYFSMKNNKLIEERIVQCNNRKISYDKLKNTELKNMIISKFNTMCKTEFSEEDKDFFINIYKYKIALDMPFFRTFFYSKVNDIIMMDVENAKNLLGLNNEDAFDDDVYQEFILEEINTEIHSVFQDSLFFKQFKDGYKNDIYLLLLKDNTQDVTTVIESYQDIIINEDERVRGGTIYTIPLSQLEGKQNYRIKESEMKFKFSPFLVVLVKEKMKQKKVEKIMQKYRDEELEYASRYLNEVIDMKETYSNEKVNIYLVS